MNCLLNIFQWISVKKKQIDQWIRLVLDFLFSSRRTMKDGSINEHCRTHSVEQHRHLDKTKLMHMGDVSI